MRTQSLLQPCAIIVVSLCFFVAVPAFGFQQTPLSNTIRLQSCQPQRQRSLEYRKSCDPNSQGRRLFDRSVDDITSSPSRQSSSTSLYAFNMNNNNNNPFNMKPNYGPIKDWKDGLGRIQMLIAATIKQFSSGFMTGYFMGAFWSLISPPATLINRGIVWGLDFGFLAAMFNGSNMIVDLFCNQIKDQNKVQLWNVVLRNIMLAVYFARSSGIVKMMRSAVMYGGLTYYFVSQKNKRDVTRMDMFQGMNMNGQSPQQATMQELLSRLQQQQQNNAATATSPSSSSPSTSASSSTSSSPSSASSTSSKAPKKTSSPIDNKNVMDVEFEKISEDDDGNENDGDVDAKN